MLTRSEAIELNKFYTKPEIAMLCCEYLAQFCHHDTLYIEPSAGAGAFLEWLVGDIRGFDLLPEHPRVIQNDYLSDDILAHLSEEERQRPLVAIGNPPFGKKASLAIAFTNKALAQFGLVGFIVPIQFRKWSVQSKINPCARLILDETLPEDSFLLLGKDYRVRCCFQVWSMNHWEKNDLRISSKPDTQHPDFSMWQYNRTEGALKYFDYDWDFAVVRQGYHDYSKKYWNEAECDRKVQWIFFKAHSQQALDRLMKMDFALLSKKNTGTPGFGKADVVELYRRTT